MLTFKSQILHGERSIVGRNSKGAVVSVRPIGDLCEADTRRMLRELREDQDVAVRKQELSVWLDGIIAERFGE